MWRAISPCMAPTGTPTARLSWKFDNYARSFPPYGHSVDDLRAIFGEITCPVLLFWGTESWLPDPEADGRASVIKNSAW